MQTNPKAGAAALIVGWLAYIGLMAVHPSHTGGPALGHVDLNDAVHWTGLLVVPLIAYGYVEMARFLGLGRALPLLALCTMMFSLFAGAGAATMSGLVMPEIAASAADADSTPELRHALGDLTYWINQGFAAVHYTLAAVGVGVFGLAWMRRPGERALGVAGVVIGAAFLVWLGSGLWRPDIHGALFTVLAIGAWSITAAFAMRKAPAEEA